MVYGYLLYITIPLPTLKPALENNTRFSNNLLGRLYVFVLLVSDAGAS